jgi:hypothetical protein
MSRSRRSSNNKNRNGNNNGGNNNNGGGGNNHRNGSSDPRDFWGAVLPTADGEPPVVDTPDPTAMVRSLGIPPLAGNRPISEHYFAAVYAKAAGLAQALLAAERPVESDVTADVG